MITYLFLILILLGLATLYDLVVKKFVRQQ